MLLIDFLPVWQAKTARLRECTRVGYDSTLRLHILPQFSHVDLDTITSNMIEAWLQSFEKAGAARKAWAVLRSILKLAARTGTMAYDVTTRQISLPKPRAYEPTIYTASEVRRLLRGFFGHTLEAWLIVSVCAGLRRCEACGVEWRDLDLRKGTVTVKRSVQWVAGHETVTEPKTAHSRRTVALPRFAVQRLAQLKHGKTGRLIGNLNVLQVARSYRKHCKTLGLDGVPPKNLRHTFGTLAIKAGADISVVARQLGHTDITTTAKYYLKPDITILQRMQQLIHHLLVSA